MAATATATRRRTLIEWLGLIGYWAIAGPFTLLMMGIGLLLPAAGAVWLAEWTFSTGVLVLEVAVATVLMIVTSAGVWFAFSRPRVVKRLRLGRFEPALWALLVAFFAVASFAALTSLLYLEGMIAISEPVKREILIDKTAEVYVWHLFDTVPLLDIPENLEWQVPFEFEDRIGGLLLILFTAIVILPLIQVVRLIATGYTHPYEGAVLRALRTNKRQAHVLRQAGRHNELAVVEGDVAILVDLMQDVSTEDYPLRRVNFAAAYHYRRGTELRGVDGYLLVVDKIAERARDRIEEAFAGSTFPAALAIWRSDQPAAHLGEAVDHLAKRMVYEAVVIALQGLPGWRTTLLPDRQEYELAIIEKRATEVAGKRILVDVMRTPSREVAPLCRLKAARDGLASEHEADGYLLVVDSVAERSRQRIEKAFAKNKLPAELFVWRSDLPSTYMAEAVKRLLQRIESARTP